MAVRKMRVSFDIDMPVFLAVLAQSNSNMRIDLFDDSKPKRLNGKSPLLLEGPRNGHSPSTGAALLDHLAKHKDQGFRMADLKQIGVGLGKHVSTSSPALAKLRAQGFVKRTGKGARDGIYQITPRGLAEHAKHSAGA
jgi:hypothetical protein